LSYEEQVVSMARGKFGERLKRERELREVSLDELSKATRISNRFLLALENEDWGKLPGGVFGHGFVRSIARYLGLSEEALLGEYDSARAEKLPSSPAKPQEPIPSPSKWIPAVAFFWGGLLLLALIFYSGWYGWRHISASRAAKPAAAAIGASRAAKPAPAPTAASADTPLELFVSTSATTHVRVIADDKVLLDSEVNAGETRQFTAKRQFDVSATNSAAVLLQLNGRAMAPLGPPGTFGRMVYTRKDLRQANGGDSKP
jgi:cytoskeletal protein RodZ